MFVEGDIREVGRFDFGEIQYELGIGDVWIFWSRNKVQG